MNTHKLLVSLLMIGFVLLSACAPAETATPPAPMPVPPTAPAVALPTSTPASPESVAGRYYYAGSFTSLIDLLPDGSYNHQDGGGAAQAGTFTVTQDQMTFTATFGPCGAAPGVYRWSSDQGTLKLTADDDPCSERSKLLTQTLKKLPQQEPYARYLWSTRIDDAAYDPPHVTLDPNGNIYLTNHHLAMISKYDPHGEPITRWNFQNITDPLNQHSAGMALDSRGNIYAENYLDGEIEKFDPNGEFLLAWKPDNGSVGPSGMGIDAQDNLYVTFFRDHSHYVEKYDTDGNLLASWAESGSGDGQSGPAYDIAVDALGNNYIADYGNFRVNAYDANGRFRFSLTGDGNYKMAEPYRLAVDPQGNLFVYDDLAQMIWMFDTNGKFIQRWFALAIRGMALNEAGNLVIVNDREIAELELPKP